MSPRFTTREMVRVSLFASLTAVGGFISIPLPLGLVPFSLQSFITYLSGIFLGPFLGALSQLIYILLGCLNLPVFAGGLAGYAVLLGPTGGYLWGFVLASFVIGGLVRIKKNTWWMLLSLLAGTAVIYGCGIWQLMAITGASFHRAFWLGAAVFLPGDIFKMVLAAYLARKVPPRFR